MSSGVSVYDGANQTENDDFGNSNSPESFGEILGFLHLSNEARNGDLANEGIADVEEGIHGADESGARSGDDENNWIAHKQTFRTASVVFVGMRFNSGKDCGQEDRNECEEC